MKTVYTGSLKMLGSADLFNQAKVYSLIEIGDDVVKNLVITNTLDNFLQKALDSENDVSIETHKHSSSDTFMRFFIYLGLYVSSSIALWYTVDHILAGLIAGASWLLFTKMWLTGIQRVPVIKSVTVDGKRYAD